MECSNSFRRKTTDMSFGFMCFFVHIKITKCKIMNSYVSFLNTLSYFHLKILLLSFHTYQRDVYPAQSHFWVNMKSSTLGGTYLHKECSLQGLLQVIMTAESTQLLCSREISSQHFGLLKLFKLFPAHTQKHIINLKLNKICTKSYRCSVQLQCFNCGLWLICFTKK